MSRTREPLFVIHVDTETGFSGGERQVFLLLEGLQERGHRNLLICPPGSRCEEEASARGIETRALRMRNHADLAAVLALRRVLVDERPDLLHLHTGRATWLGGLGAWLARVPAITTRRMDRRVRPGLRTRLTYGVLVERAVAISPAVARQMREGRVPDSRIVTIPSSIDPDALAPTRAAEITRQNLGAQQGATVLLTMAALVRRKGLDILLRALARPELAGPTLLWIAGSGPERQTLEALAVELGVAARVRFLGRREDVGDLLAACDVFVLPSRLEGLGVAALEAMAAVRPVVASAVGGLADVVQDGRTGLLVPPEDPAALARALARLTGDPALRQSLGKAGRERLADGLLAEQMVASYEALYFEVRGSAARQASGASMSGSKP